jgi:hypothetical protein
MQPNDPASPLLIGEKAVTAGRRRHRHVVAFQLDFNAALNAQTAEDAANYTVVRRVKHGHKMVSRSVPFRPVYDPTTDSVQLDLAGRQKFRRGGRIQVNPPSPGAIADAASTRLEGAAGGSPVATATIVILRRARGLVS